MSTQEIPTHTAPPITLVWDPVSSHSTRPVSCRSFPHHMIIRMKLAHVKWLKKRIILTMKETTNDVEMERNKRKIT